MQFAEQRCLQGQEVVLSWAHWHHARQTHLSLMKPTSWKGKPYKTHFHQSPWLGASLQLQFHIDGISLLSAQWRQRKDTPKPSSLWIMSQEWNAPTQAPPLLLPHCPSRLLTLTTVALSETKKTPFAFACWMMQTHLLTFLDEHFSSVNGPAMISLPCQWGGSGESLFNVPSKESFYAVWHQGKTQAGFPTAQQSSWEGSPKPLPPFQGPSLWASYLMAWADIQL